MPKAAYITAKKSGITAITKPNAIRDFNDKIFLNFSRPKTELNRPLTVELTFEKSFDKSGFLKISRTKWVMNSFIDFCV